MHDSNKEYVTHVKGTDTIRFFYFFHFHFESWSCGLKIHSEKNDTKLNEIKERNDEKWRHY